MKWSSRWCRASVFSGSAQARAAIGSTLLRSASPNNPNAYSENEARRFSYPSRFPMRSK